MALYSDLNQLTPTASPTVSGLDSIYQGITNILSTPKHSRLFMPEFGADIEVLLFDLMNEITISKLYDEIIEAILRWDSRVSIDYGKSNITPNYDENKYELLLIFKVSGYDEEFEYRGELLRP